MHSSTVLTVHLSVIAAYSLEGRKTIPSPKGFVRNVLEEPVEVSQFDKVSNNVLSQLRKKMKKTTLISKANEKLTGYVLIP